MARRRCHRAPIGSTCTSAFRRPERFGGIIRVRLEASFATAQASSLSRSQREDNSGCRSPPTAEPWTTKLILDGFSETPQGRFAEVSLSADHHRLRVDGDVGINYIIGPHALMTQTGGIHAVFMDWPGIHLGQITDVPLAIRETGVQGVAAGSAGLAHEGGWRCGDQQSSGRERGMVASIGPGLRCSLYWNDLGLRRPGIVADTRTECGGSPDRPSTRPRLYGLDATHNQLLLAGKQWNSWRTELI